MTAIVVYAGSNPARCSNFIAPWPWLGGIVLYTVAAVFKSLMEYQFNALETFIG